MKETDVAALLVAWLTGLGWDVYEEVDGIDVVATRGPLCWIVEVKKSFSHKLLGQCMRRHARGRAHLVSGAAKLPKDHDSRDAVVASYQALGLGVLDVRERPALDYRIVEYVRGVWLGDEPPVVEVVRPALRRRLHHDIRPHLRPEHKTHCAAGSPGGGGWTPFKATCRALLDYVIAHPGALLSDVVKAIEHHYVDDKRASATLRVQIERGIVPGVRSRLRRIGRATGSASTQQLQVAESLAT